MKRSRSWFCCMTAVGSLATWGATTSSFDCDAYDVEGHHSPNYHRTVLSPTTFVSVSSGSRHDDDYNDDDDDDDDDNNNSNRDEEESTLWYELPPTRKPTLFAPSSSLSSTSSPPRKLIWWGRYDDEETWKKPEGKNNDYDKKSTRTVSHPLRSNRYHVTVQWRNKKKNYTKALPRELELEFDVATGYCRATSTPTTTATAGTTVTASTCASTANAATTLVVVGVGEWHVGPWGLCCHLWVDKTVQLVLNAGVHLNPFGTHAKLLQGSVIAVDYDHDIPLGGYIPDPIQDQPMVSRSLKWFRPVVGTFSGVSQGDPTTLGTYPTRGIGLSS